MNLCITTLSAVSRTGNCCQALECGFTYACLSSDLYVFGQAVLKRHVSLGREGDVLLQDRVHLHFTIRCRARLLNTKRIHSQFAHVHFTRH